MQIEKAYEITDAKIQFVSLVDKAANKRQFLITKAEKGQAQFTTYGRIIKVDAATHHVTGIVYEPFEEDTQGDFMTPAEIEKAAYWFAKNGDKIDLMHNFEALKSVAVVENWVTKSEETIAGEKLKKGTWLITVEIEDDAIWEKIEKGEITGFSMGGFGTHHEEDVPLDGLEKGAHNAPGTTEEKKSIFKKLAGLLGIDVVEKGEMADEYQRRQKSSGFWNAVDTLTALLSGGHWDYTVDRYVYDFESNEERIREALEDFNTIVTSVLTEGNIAKMLAAAPPDTPIQKAGRKMSGKNKQKLDEIRNALETFAKEFEENDEEEENEVNKEDIQKMIDEAIAKMAPKPADTPPAAGASENGGLTIETVEKAVEATIQKLLKPEPEELTPENLEATIEKVVQKAMEPILKARGLATNLNDDGNPVHKSEDDHYLKGYL
jgi:hypothetical protein